MSEPEESKEDVPNTLPDDQQQQAQEEETLEKKVTNCSITSSFKNQNVICQSESKLQTEENNLNDSGDKTETDEKVQEEDENAPAATPDHDTVEGAFFDESKPDDENEPKAVVKSFKIKLLQLICIILQILGMTEESENVSPSKVDISGVNQASEEVPINSTALTHMV